MTSVLFVTIAFSILYSEWIWSMVKSEHKTYQSADRILKMAVSINFMLGVFVHAWGCLIFASICALYQMVIFKYRKETLDGPVA